VRRRAVLKPGFFEHAQKMSLLRKAESWPSVVDRHPSVGRGRFCGEGLLGLVQGVVPPPTWSRRCASKKLLTVRDAHGDNVVRFLPPLIVTEAEIEESVARLEARCVALSGDQVEGGCPGNDQAAASFLDISALLPGRTAQRCSQPATP